MPFGCVTAPATFSKIMRKLLYHLDGTDNYLDDILVFSETWSDHLQTLRSLFERLRAANLTARPSKCSIGFSKLNYLGHFVGQRVIRPMENKIESIKQAEPPKTKKQLQSFLGLVGYYRQFVPNFSAVAVPLTDLTRKGQPNKLEWGNAQNAAFISLKQVLSNSPVLRLPDFTKTFILRTDASGTGLLGILLQEFEDGKFPLAYASKKFLPRETRSLLLKKNV
ncbi:hypothetical protein SNE40_015771 [Patella caerulea]|uniref:Reverse transcriptase domain-containing protein n=1 Tax=Patella caerulea TaxID=87958 RepID=A0AAN8JKL0_PATCE